MRSLVLVPVDVVLVVALCSKAFIADLAFERLLLCMSAMVDAKIALLCYDLAADLVTIVEQAFVPRLAIYSDLHVLQIDFVVLFWSRIGAQQLITNSCRCVEGLGGS